MQKLRCWLPPIQSFSNTRRGCKSLEQAHTHTHITKGIYIYFFKLCWICIRLAIQGEHKWFFFKFPAGFSEVRREEENLTEKLDFLCFYSKVWRGDHLRLRPRLDAKKINMKRRLLKVGQNCTTDNYDHLSITDLKPDLSWSSIFFFASGFVFCHKTESWGIWSEPDTSHWHNYWACVVLLSQVWLRSVNS